MKTDVISLKPGSRQLTRPDVVDNNREVIKEYLMAGGLEMELNAKQSELLARWEYADEKIRENMGKLSRSEIANLVKKQFGVSLCTAKSDLVNAEYVFSSSNPLNKAHKIALRIEFLEKQIRLAATDNDHKAVAMLEKTLAKYLEIYPEITPVEVPKTLVFSFDVEKLMPQVMPQTEAESILDRQIEKNKFLDAFTVDIEEEGGFGNE